MGTKAVYESEFLRFYNNATLGDGGERIAVFAPLFFYDDFVGKEVDATNDWNETIVNGSTTTTVAGTTGGIARLTTGVADDDTHELASSTVLKASKGIGCEARIALGDVDATAFNFGFADAVTFGADHLQMDFSLAALTTNAADAALFFTDSDATTNVVRAAAVKANVDSAITAGSSLPADAEYHVYRIEIDTSGNATFYYDGALFASIAACITVATAVCVYLGLRNEEGAANTLDCDYIRYWQLTR